jgi:hypothetical protein
MNKTFNFCDRKQMIPSAPRIQKCLPQGCLSHFRVDSLVELDLSTLYSVDGGGPPPWGPERVISFLVNACCIGVVSTRTIEIDQLVVKRDSSSPKLSF